MLYQYIVAALKELVVMHTYPLDMWRCILADNSSFRGTYHTVEEILEGTLDRHTLHTGFAQCSLPDSTLGILKK